MTALRERAKGELRRLSPEMYSTAELIYVNEIAYAREFFASGAASRLRRYTSERGWSVIDGPFTGMSYPPVSAPWVRDLGAKLIGSYEAGIQGVVERLVSMAPRRVIDIGSAEGYYAVGFALRLPDARVVAVDIDPLARFLCRGLSRRNGVIGRVAVEAEADLADVKSGEGALVFMDCEGAEYHLADPARFPALEAATIVIELHEFFHRDLPEVLRDRFARTHTVELHGEERPVSAFDRLAHWPDGDAEKLLNERRPEPMRWALLLPR
jgi:hypothetical protein